jgi:hypothetical protein
MSMRFLINIPKEFEQHFQEDRFENSLHRLSADAHLIAGLYEKETAKMLIDAFKNAIPVPPHGRLIDADALHEELYALEYARENEWRDGMREARGVDAARVALLDAPTIIEAEEGE